VSLYYINKRAIEEVEFRVEYFLEPLKYYNVYVGWLNFWLTDFSGDGGPVKFQTFAAYGAP
jgi:hypothetical protein